MRTLLILLALASPVFAQAPAVERGKLLLHFLQLPVGEETYEIAPQPDGSRLLTASFEYTERGSNVPLKATLRTRPDLTPIEFQAKGKSYRPFSVNASVTVSQLHPPARFFTISGYAPFSVQMLLLRYWASHGKPSRLRQYPAAETDPDTDIAIEVSGADTIHIDGRAIRLTRYSLTNVVWGRESVWLDPRGVIAAATTYAGGLPFEAIREEYRAALPQLIRASVADRIRELAAISAAIHPIASGSFAITGARLIDGVSSDPVPDAVVVVRDGKIAAAGPRAQIAVPAGVPVIDGRGSTLLPGLWEMHAHFAQVDYGPAYLAAGVTTARDCGGEFEFVTAVRDLINSRGGLSPRMLLAGLVDGSGTGTFGVIWADTPEQGRAVVAKYKAAGFAQMKIYNRIKPDVLAAIVAEAHRLGMSVTGHVPEGMTAITAVEAGMDQINHIGSVAQAMRANPQAVQFFKDHHTVVDPTMSWNELLGRPMNQEIASFEPGYAKAPYSLTSLIGTAGTPANASGRGRSPAATLEAVRVLHAAGVPIVAGTDKAVPAHSLHRELELYVEAGIPPMEVIQLATIGSARVMKLDSETGSITPGKRADLLLVEGNPLENFADLRKVVRVAVGGRLYAPAELWKSVGFKP